MGTILVVHDELNSLELPVFKKDDGSKPELRYFPMVPWIQCAYTRKCMTLKNVTKAYHLPEQSVLTVLIRENNLTLSCVQKRSYYPFMWRDNNPRNRVIPNTELQFDIASVNDVTGRNYTQNFFTKCISYCVSLQQFF